MADLFLITALLIGSVMLTQFLSISLSSSVGNTVAGVTLPEAMRPMAGQDLRKAKMARHASFNIAPTSLAVQRQVSSAPSSPRREPAGKRHSEFCNTLFFVNATV